MNLPGHWTKDLNDFLVALDQACFALGIDGSIPIQYRNNDAGTGLWDVISTGERLKLIHPGQTVLDMGSGSGTSSIIWAHRGYNVIGIELMPDLVRMSRQGIRNYQKHFGKNGDIEIIQGSYYPATYIRKRETGNSLAVRIENDMLMSGSAGHGLINRFHAICEKDVYAKHHIDLKTIDIFYAYKYKIQAPSVLEMFSMYSKKDAVLGIISLVDDIVGRFGLEKDVRYCYVGRDIKKRINKGDL